MFDKDDFNKILSAERHLFDASMDLGQVTHITDLDEAIKDLESVEYEAMFAILRIKEVKAKLGAEHDEN